MMIFNPDQCNFLLKRGAIAIGAGTHKRTHKFYIFFNQDAALKKAMDEWAEMCRQTRQ